MKELRSIQRGVAIALVLGTVSSPSWARGFTAPRPARQAPRMQMQQRTQLQGNVNSNNGTFAQNHPRRAEVIGRDQNLNNQINGDRGNLQGHYNQFEQQDRSIYNQEQSDARQNGGYITPGQQGQLNREETALGNEVKYNNTNNSFVQNHPRRAEVLGRDANLNYSINKDEGHLGGHYSQLESQDQSIQNQEQRDARQNGGYITQGQQGQLNREENALGNEVKYDNTNNSFVQNHPRRAEVLSRDANLNYNINKDEGHLGGHYSQLESQDQSIQNQEQRDASQNGGYITQGQQAQLNREENALHNEVKYDNTNSAFTQNHPWRAQVLGRDANLNYQINKDQGHLSGQYSQLATEDNSIARQEQTDARTNGGYLTGAQRTQLNQEETALRNQITQDNTQ